MRKLLVALLSITILLSGCSSAIETPAPLPNAVNNQNDNIALQADTFTIFRGFPRIYSSINEESFLSVTVLSELRLFPFNWRQVQFVPCDGARLPISDNTALYSIIGDTWGGDGGKTYFSLPDFANKPPLPGLTYHICIDGAYPVTRETSGKPNREINYYPITNPDYVTELYLSEIVLAKNANTRVPKYLVPCDGRLLRIRENQALYSLLMNRFGGDGQNTFAVPNLSAVQSPVPGAAYYISVYGMFPPPI